MAKTDFTSGPLRELSANELGNPGFSDFELLSDSGHNRVYRALSGGKWVVLKVAKEEEGNTARNRLLLKREYDIMHDIDCLYVVKTWQMTDVPELGTAIVMEYVAGRTLDRFMQEQQSMSERRRVADELLEALIFLHERQIVHGDLKPSNILITDSGNHVRLIDFGFADTDAYIAKNIGTSPSIADALPEENEQLSIAKDIYALGKVLEMLFPGRLRFVVRRCCSADNRYSSVRDVRAAIHRYWRTRWILPLMVFVGICIALLAVLFPHRNAPVVQPVAQTDTVVIIAQPAQAVQPEIQSVLPAVDSTWLTLEKQANSRYKKLYRLYTDSLTNMPEKSLNVGIAMTSRYAERMWTESDRLIRTHLKYEKQLQEQYLRIYTRDLPKLQEIYKNYPVVL